MQFREPSKSSTIINGPQFRRTTIRKLQKRKRKKRGTLKIVELLQFCQMCLFLIFQSLYIRWTENLSEWHSLVKHTFHWVSKWSGRFLRSKNGQCTRDIAGETCARANTIHLNPIILADYWLDSVCSLCRWSRLTLSLPCLVRLHIYIINYITLLIIIFTLAEHADTYTQHTITLCTQTHIHSSDIP